jgi:uncharacterized glyoxalase superfamily protein PhnB
MFYPPGQLPKNRSIPSATVVPVLAYPDVREAVGWLEKHFGFRERLQIADHRSQIKVGGGAMIVAEYIGGRENRPETAKSYFGHQIMVRVPDVNAHYERVKALGAEILQPPVDHMYGERQYEVKDIGGHRWTFSETLSDADPAEWGGDKGVVLKIES